MKRLAVAALVALAFAQGGAHAAGFDCKRAAEPVEKLICADKALSRADDELARLYGDRLRASATPGKLVAAQRQWLRDVRGKCTTAACLKAAYEERARVLNGTVASFDCDKAAAPVERRICASDQLRYWDRKVGDAFRDLKDVVPAPDRFTAEQKGWLRDVRDRCPDEACLASALGARSDALAARWQERLDAAAARTGYGKQPLYADLMALPGDRNRLVAAFATQDSAADAAGGTPAPDEDFTLDLYVVDAGTGKALQHVRETVASDALALSGMRLDRTNHGAALGVPAFGILLDHFHAGCAAYAGTSTRLYAIDGKSLRQVVGDLVMSASAGMCGTDCESHETFRTLQAAPRAAARYPELTVSEVMLEDAPGQRAGECRTTRTQATHTLRYDGKRYPLPPAMAY